MPDVQTSATSEAETAEETVPGTEDQTQALEPSPSQRGMENEPFEMASPDDLGPEEDWTFVDLPRLRRRVQVRYAGTHEITYLSLLPDMIDFAKFAVRAAARQEAGEEDEEETETEGRDEEKAKEDTSFTAENIRWRQRLAHLVVMVPGQEKPVRCADCAMVHPPSLWTFRRTSRLHGDDLLAIAEAALSVREFRTVRPFSKARTQSGSREPAGTGESTPRTSSA